MTDIDKLGEEVAAQIKSAEADRVKIAPGLRRVWAELEAKRPVNGVKSKGAWAEKFGVTLRYCQYIVKDGDRKRSEKKDTNPVRVVELKAGMVVKFGKDGALYTVVAEPAIHEDQDNEHSIILKLDTYKPEPLPKKKKLSTKVIHAIHVRPSDHEVTGTFCGLDETKVQTAGLDADGYGNLSGITCKRCLRKSKHDSYGFGKDQPTAAPNLKKQPACKDCGKPADYEYQIPVLNKNEDVVGTKSGRFYCETHGLYNDEELDRNMLVELHPSKKQPAEKVKQKKDTRKAHLPYSPDYGNVYTTYCGKPLDGLKLVGREQEDNITVRKCAKCVQAKFGDKSKRPFTDLCDAEVAVLVGKKKEQPTQITLVVKDNCPPEEAL